MNKYDIIITDVYYINNGREAEVLPGEILLVELGADKELKDGTVGENNPANDVGVVGTDNGDGVEEAH